MSKYLAIAIGGALGSCTRYLIGSSLNSRYGLTFPFGTFVVNLSACLLIGFSIALLDHRPGANPFWRFLVPIGFIGAYSTFSTFEFETLSNLQLGEFLPAALYVAASILLGLLAVWGGAQLARLL